MDQNSMPQDSLSFLQRLHEYGVLGYLWLLFVSMWAGTAKYLTSLNGRKPTFLGWLSETVVSGFVGIISAMTCHYYGFDFLLTSAITGICAHNGTRSLYLIGELLKKGSNAQAAKLVEQPIATQPRLNSGERKDENDTK